MHILLGGLHPAVVNLVLSHQCRSSTAAASNWIANVVAATNRRICGARRQHCAGVITATFRVRENVVVDGGGDAGAARVARGNTSAAARGAHCSERIAVKVCVLWLNARFLAQASARLVCALVRTKSKGRERLLIKINILRIRFDLYANLNIFM